MGMSQTAVSVAVGWGEVTAPDNEWKQIVAANPTRLWIAFYIIGADFAQMVIPSAGGQPLGIAGISYFSPKLTYSYSQDGPIVGMEWWRFGAGGTTIAFAEMVSKYDGATGQCGPKPGSLRAPTNAFVSGITWTNNLLAPPPRQKPPTQPPLALPNIDIESWLAAMQQINATLLGGMDDE